MTRTWFDRNEYFPEFKDGTFTRDEMTEEREREWVDFCFEAYESDGFVPTFGTPYDDGLVEFKGMKYEVLSRVKEFKDDPNGADLECLPMWNIRLENGKEIAAYPEEICLSETIEYKEKNKNAFISE